MRSPLGLAVVLALAGCSVGGADALWSIPVGGLYNVQFADLGDVVVIPRGQAIEGYDTSGTQLWSVTLADEAESCVAAGAGAMCVAGTQIFVGRDGQAVARPDLAFIAQAGDKAYYARGDADGVVLIEADADAPIDQLGGEVLARYEGRTSYLPDGTPVERADSYPEPLQRLLDVGLLDADSPWLNPAGIASIARPLADGFVVVEAGQITVSDVEPTVLTLFDLDGNETARLEATPALTMNLSPRWTLATLEQIVEEANALDTSRAFVFDDARVVGFEQALTDSVAPGYADVEALIVGGQMLRFDAIRPETLQLSVLDYPYVSVAGTGSGSVVATFDIVTGERVIEASCWQNGAVYCATPTELSKIDLSGRS